MSRARCVAFACLLLALGSSAVQGAVGAKTVAEGKRATALVVLPGRGFASAFCVSTAGFFVTNAHVVARAERERKVSLVLRPAEEDQLVIDAAVRRVDKEADLALLEVKGAKGLVALALGEVKGLTETQELVAFGYPFGTALAVQKGEYPSVSVNVGRITSLRKSKGALKSIQLDAQLNPGNSGGPVLDVGGKVVGVVRSGLLATGVNFAVPVSQLHKFLAKPDIRFQLPTIHFARRHETVKASVHVEAFTAKLPDYEVDLELRHEGAAPRTVAATKQAPGSFRLSFMPVPKRAGPLRVPLTIQYAKGTVECELPDQVVTLGHSRHRLSSVARIAYRDGKLLLVRKDGQERSGDRLILEDPEIDLGDVKFTLDPSRAVRIIVHKLPRDPGQLRYRLTVKREGTVAGTKEGVIQLAGAPSATPGAGTRPPSHAAAPQKRVLIPSVPSPRLASDPLTVRLPEKYARMCTGGAGRYHVFLLTKARKLAVLDSATARVAGEVPLTSETALIAAGLDKLMIVYPGLRLVQRWSLSTLEREATVRVRSSATNALMGASSDGPLFLVYGNDLSVFDAQSMTEPPKTIDMWGRIVSCSADGRHFLTTGQSYTRNFHRFCFTDRPYRRIGGTKGGDSRRERRAFPGARSRLIFAHECTIYSGDWKRLSASFKGGTVLMPCEDPRFFVAIEAVQARPVQQRVSICTSGDRRPVFSLDVAENVNSIHENRVRYIPSANVLLTFPAENDRVVFRRLDLFKELERTAEDYFFILSVPKTRAKKGSAYSHRIDARSRAGGVTFALENGPKGMTVSATGEVRWKVPRAFEDKTAGVIILVKDATGRELFHVFDINVE